MGDTAVKIATLSLALVVVMLSLSFSVTSDATAGAKTSRVCAAKTVAELSVCRRGDQVSFAPTTLESVHIPALTARFCDLTINSAGSPRLQSSGGMRQALPSTWLSECGA